MAGPIPTTSKVIVGTTSTIIVGFTTSPRSAMVTVVSGGPLYVGPSPATVNGYPLNVGETLPLYESSAPLCGIVAAGTADVRIWDEVAP